MVTDDTPGVGRRGLLKALGLLGLAGTVPSSATAGTSRAAGPKKDEVLVGVSDDASSVRGAVGPHVPGNAELVHVNDTLQYAAVKFPSRAADVARTNFAEAVTSKPGIEYAETNETHTRSYTPNDPGITGDYQYAPEMVNALEAWDTTLGSAGVTIAVVDTGVQYDHPDLQSQFGSNKGYDFADDDADPYPDAPNDEYHGTHVAGIAAATTDNDQGVAGISNASLLSYRGLDEEGGGSTSDIADAVQQAADAGADVINLSLGGGGSSETMQSAVQYARDQGALIVAAAGNAGENSVDYPAAYEECLAVSALDEDGTLASYSNYGPEIDVAAPGTDVMSTTTTERDSYERLSGTSMATPVVSGVAALALSQWDLTDDELWTQLTDTAVDIGLSAEKQGAGRVDAANAVETDPNGGSDGGTSDSETTTVTDSLDGYWDSDCWTYPWQFSSPSSVELVLDGPSDSDFDLYASEATTECPTTSGADHSSTSYDSQESITIENPDTSTDLSALVDSYSGGGEYTLTITEYSG